MLTITLGWCQLLNVSLFLKIKIAGSRDLQSGICLVILLAQYLFAVSNGNRGIPFRILPFQQASMDAFKMWAVPLQNWRNSPFFVFKTTHKTKLHTLS